MGNLWNRTLTFDAKTMRFEDWNGHLRVKKTNLTKANICEYYGFEIKNHMKYGLEPERKYRFLRSPDALKKAVFSFKERPILYVHKAADADQLDNSKVIGTTGSDPSFSYPYIQASITIWDGDYIQAIKNNTQAELSASYAFTPVMETGMFENEPYDGMMTDINVDHIALVEQGRAGHDVRVADERLNIQMSKLNNLGQKLALVLADFLNQSKSERANYTQITDAVASVSGARRKYIGKLLKAVLSDRSMAKDCKDGQQAEKIVGLVHKVLSENDQNSSVNDDDSIDTISTSDDDMNVLLENVIGINAQSIIAYDNTKEYNLDYIIIGCRIPNGLVIKVDGQNILLRGIRDMPGKDSRRFFGNIGFTRLPRDLWNEFLKCHSKWSPLVNGSVFIASCQDDCSDA